MGMSMPTFKVNLKITWYEALLAAVTFGLVAFGLWALVDSLAIGSSKAGWRFLMVFAIWALPGLSVLVFLRPRKS